MLKLISYSWAIFEDARGVCVGGGEGGGCNPFQITILQNNCINDWPLTELLRKIIQEYMNRIDTNITMQGKHSFFVKKEMYPLLKMKITLINPGSA